MLDFTLHRSLNNFIDDCSQVLRELDSAKFTEGLDAATSDNTLFGFGVTLLSRSKNYHVANQVDRLAHKAEHINRMLERKGIFQNYRINGLNTNFNEEGIREAENDQHGFFANFFTNGNYSSYGSMNVMSKISNTAARIRETKGQAVRIIQRLSGNQLCGERIRPGFFPSRVRFRL